MKIMVSKGDGMLHLVLQFRHDCYFDVLRLIYVLITRIRSKVIIIIIISIVIIE